MNRFLHTLLVALLATTAAAAADYSGTLPVMYINTEGSAPITSKETYLQATYYVDALGLPGYESVGAPDAQLAMQIRGRGNWSWTGFEKKPYRIKLDKKAALLGMPSSKHFALMAHADDTYGFLRNPVGFWLSETLGLPWTPKQEPVEVMLNGEYIGLYFLTETVRVDKDRVDIVDQPDNATDPEVITGGWLVELDNYANDPHITIKEGNGNDMIITYKTPEVLSEEQTQYLTDQMTTINAEVYDSNKQVCQWAAHVDIPTLAKYYIVQEIVDDYESFHGSCYINKQQGNDQKWMFGPVWDFGSAFNYTKTQYIYQGREYRLKWIGEMCKFPGFMDEVKALWADFYATQYYPMLDYVQQFATKISAAAIADARRWPQYGNPDEQAKANIVKSRLRTSCSWLASQWGGVQQAPDLQPITIYYINSESNPWSQCYAYSWDNGPDGDGTYYLYGYWPGAPMLPTVINGESAWVITATPTQEMSDAPGLVLNNGGSGSGNQTADLVLINGAAYRYDGSYTGTIDAEVTSIEVRPVVGGVIISSPIDTVIAITSIDGMNRLQMVKAGSNRIDLRPGFYIIANHKIAVK